MKEFYICDCAQVENQTITSLFVVNHSKRWLPEDQRRLTIASFVLATS